MIQFSDKVSKMYCLYIITEVESEEVRTVTMGLHNRRAQGLKNLPLELKRTGIQQFDIILPASEQNLEEKKMAKKFMEEAKATAMS